MTNWEFIHGKKNDNYESLAKKLIISIDGQYNNYYVLFSGGKDSLCVLDLVAKNLESNFKVIYIEPNGNTHPLCNEYVHYMVEDYYGLDLIHLRSNEDFFELLRQYGYPSCIWYHSRWCLNRLKNQTLRKFQKLKYAVTFSGMKLSDSSNRNHYISERFFNGMKKNKKPYIFWGLVSILPIFRFSKNDVWHYIKRNKLPLNPCYKLINNSGNCVICPYNTFDSMRKIKENAPLFFQKWIKTHEIIRANLIYEERKEKIWISNCGLWHVFQKFDKYYCNLKTDLGEWGIK